jgi:hypothetical protein
MTDKPSALDDHDFMDALLNIVIPPSASGELPGAGSLGLSPAVAGALRADPLLGPLVESGGQAVRDAALAEHSGGLPAMPPKDAKAVLEAQLASHPILIMGLLRHLYPAYYQHPQVLAGIGEPPRPPFPEGFEVEPTDPELIQKLHARRKSPETDTRATLN